MKSRFGPVHDDDLYQILDVSPQASTQDIKKAYRKLALIHHPDKNQSQIKLAEDKFKRIKHAYETLSDGTKRDEYDQSKLHNFNQQPFSGFNDFNGFTDFNSSFSNIFGNMSGGVPFQSDFFKRAHEHSFSSFGNVFSDFHPFDSFKSDNSGDRGSSRTNGAKLTKSKTVNTKFVNGKRIVTTTEIGDGEKRVTIEENGEIVEQYAESL